jgi:hypothetical protein
MADGADGADDQVTRLVEAVQDWARRAFPETPDGHRPSECQWCPLCQFVGVLRRERPDVSAKVAEAGTALLAALRSLGDLSRGAGGGGSASAPGDGPPPGEPPGPRPRLQRIDLGAADSAADDEPRPDHEPDDEPGLDDGADDGAAP